MENQNEKMAKRKPRNLSEFYHGKAKDPAGGSFFQVFTLSQRMTWWGRSMNELKRFLAEKRIQWIKIRPLN